jgi:glyoxylase-like metal-dependent hydrolase (beta-lactamase superfamily II)
MMTDVYQLSNRLYIIDTYDLKRKGRTASYVLKEDELTIIETSASPSVPHLLNGLSELGLSPDDIKNIIVTHIHLDHAGGAGLLLKHCPNAKVIVHPKGAKHLADPSRLIKGAKAVYGEKFEQLFDPILPIPEDRMVIKHHGETLKLSDSCTLTFYDTPGHSRHHFSIYDSKSKGIFSGDTLGIYYNELKKEKIDFILPSTSPNQFDPDEMLQSTSFIENLDVKEIYFSHFGVCHDPETVYSSIRKWMPIFLQAGEAGVQSITNNDFNAAVQAVEKELKNRISTYLTNIGVPENHKVYEILSVDCQVCAMGLVDYLTKKK